MALRSVSTPSESGLSPWATVGLRTGSCWSTEKRGPPVIEIVLLSLMVTTAIVVLAGLVGRLGDLDDVKTMRDMVDRW